jgi:hypothetical protein
MCERAGLLIGWDESAKRALVTRANCDSWSCVECAARMSARWVLRAQMGVHSMIYYGQEVDFVTITSHEKLKTFQQTEHVWREAWSRLYAALKRKSPQLQYMIVPEKHKDGRMHVHALWNAGVSKKWLKDGARKRGLGYQADVKHVLSEIMAVRYVTKYIGKSLGDDVPKHFRRVRVSSGWTDIPEPDTALGNLRWEYIGTNGALWSVYQEVKQKDFDLIDLATGEFFDDVDLGTIVA